MPLINIRPDGSILTLYDDIAELLEEDGTAEVSRASHVEPAPGGGWTADMSPVGGPILGQDEPFNKRSDALAAEVRWLYTNRF